MMDLFAKIFEKLRWIHHNWTLKIAKRQYAIDSSVHAGLSTTIYGSGSISIEKNTCFGYNCMMQCDSATIDIGSNCAFAHNIQIRTCAYDLDSEIGFVDARNRPNVSKNIKIGDDCWIGCNMYINHGVEIGSNVVIGTNSVVTKSIESNGLYGGIPAKLIRNI